MNDAIILNGKRHVPVRRVALERQCDQCSLRYVGICADALDVGIDKSFPICLAMRCSHFEVDNEETWEDMLLKTQGRTLYMNGECLGEVWGAFFVPHTAVSLFTQGKREHELTLEVVRKLLEGEKVIHSINVYELKGGEQ